MPKIGKKEPSDDEILEARRISKLFVDAPQMDRATQEGFVRCYYDSIHGRPLHDIPEKQLFRIADRLYAQNRDWARKETSAEKDRNNQIYSVIDRLKEMRTGEDDAAYELEERICIMTENLLESDPVVMTYNAEKISRGES